MATIRSEVQAPPDVSEILLKRFRRADAFVHLATLLDSGHGRIEPIWLRGLSGSARSLLVASLARRSPGGMVLVVVPDGTVAEDLKEDLLFLLGKRSAAVFPDPGLEPYQARHPKVSLRAGRIEVLAALADPEWRGALSACSHLEVVIATAVSLSVPVPVPEDFRRSVHTLRLGQTVDLDHAVESLVRTGYSSVPMVAEYGDLARRGGILDVFSFGRDNPIRIEFDGDEVASIREFDAYSQRSISPLSEAVLLPMWEWLPSRERLEELRGSVPEGVDPEEWEQHLESLEADGTLEGIEWSLPVLGIRAGRLAGYFSEKAVVAVDGPTFVRARRTGWKAELEEAFEALGVLGARAGGEGGAEGVVADRRRPDARGTDWILGHSLGLPPSPPREIFQIEDPLEELFPRGPQLYLGSGITPRPREPRDGDGETDGAPETTSASETASGVEKTSGVETPGDGDGSGARAGDDVRSGERDGDAHGGRETRIELEGSERTRVEFHTVPPESFGRKLQQTRTYIQNLYDRTPEIHILCDTENHRERLMDILTKVPARFHVGNLASGFLMPDEGLAVLTDHEIFSRVRRRTPPRRFARGMSLKELLALTPGDYVVHVEHGISRYKGMNRLVVDGQETDCLSLEYLGGDILYVPVDQLMMVQKYSAEEGARPALSKLGGKSWARTKAKVKKSIKDMAEELIRTYAIRKSRPGFAFSADTQWQKQLEASFPYEETPDQLTAIEEVREDMESPNPMDRLICGDVGYGKTEVAIRAAFKAVQDGKQVAVLVPTTLLAQQHYETFTERLAGYPVVVDYLSRFRTGAETRQVIERLQGGKVDIVIGTHKMLGKAVKFRDLGLLVVDEEQLFGVAHKERLKKYRETIDVLTMTATPIPRTMHLALMGGRDMSIILTPPGGRRPIQTEIVEFREDVIAHSLMQEADRGGQSFFVHNRVETIDSMASYLGKLVPHLRLAVGHGQMRERALEEVMHAFLAGEYDVLISTMIIESGLDLPNVNTILINRGDTFGLAQLYQLRGRVGRSTRKAYAYLLLPPHRAITEQAQKRLKAMEEFEDLGSGYQLALRDLEIRGAGDLLGSQQSGFIISVGFELYCQLLDEAVRELKGVERDEYREPKMTTDIEAFLPETYVPDPREKINMYKSLADARSLERVEELGVELADRFGKHPDPVRHLLGLRRIRILGARVGVEKLTVREDLVQFGMGRDLKRGELQAFLQSVPFQVELLLHGRHRIRLKSPGPGEAVSTALILLRALDQAGRN
jgi:transcription-repair coupling factor